MDILAALPEAKSYATRKNAQRKLNQFAGAIPKEATTLTIPNDAGRWLAVVIYRDGLTMNIPLLANNGICITN
jgi:hypothetical protein